MSDLREKTADWKGFYRAFLTEDDRMRILDNPQAISGDWWVFANEAVDLGYSLSVRAFGYKATYVAELYGKYKRCPNAGYKLTAEANDIESAMAALMLKAERLSLRFEWPTEDENPFDGIY